MWGKDWTSLLLRASHGHSCAKKKWVEACWGHLSMLSLGSTEISLGQESASLLGGKTPGRSLENSGKGDRLHVAPGPPPRYVTLWSDG